MNKYILTLLVSCTSIGSLLSYRTQDMNHEFASDAVKRAREEISDKQYKIQSLNADIAAIEGKLDTLKKQCPKNPITCLPSSLGMAAEKANIKAKELQIEHLQNVINDLKSKHPQLN